MPAMKVTTDAAMRARDVSRPHAEHLAWAEEAEDAEDAEEGVAVVMDSAAEADIVIEIDVVIEATAAEVTATRRRRVRGARSSSRRGRPSR